MEQRGSIFKKQPTLQALIYWRFSMMRSLNDLEDQKFAASNIRTQKAEKICKKPTTVRPE